MSGKSLDPYAIKVAISTVGPKGGRKNRQRFLAGSIKDIRNDWQNRGVQIVNRNQAEYIIVPDGSVMATNTIAYSEFVNLLDTYPHIQNRPVQTDVQIENTKNAARSKKSIVQSDDVLELTETLAFINRQEIGFLTIKHQLSDMSNHEEINRGMESFSVSKGVLESKVEPAIVKTVHYDKAMGLLRYFQQERIQNVITNVLDAKSTFHYQVYHRTHTLLTQYIQSLQILLRYWAELRYNVEIFMDVPARFQHSEEHPCQPEAVSYLSSPSVALSEAWLHFRKTFNFVEQNILSNHDMLQNLSQDKYPAMADYFWKMETDLLLMYMSVQCAHIILRKRYDTWARDVHQGYAEFLRDASNNSKCVVEASSSFAMCFQGKPKPLVCVLDELVTALCDVLSSETKEPLYAALWHSIQDINQNWFHHEKTETQSLDLRKQIQKSYGVIRSTLLHELHVDDVIWSAIPIPKQIDMNDLFSKQAESRKPVFEYLVSILQSQEYQNRVAALVL